MKFKLQQNFQQPDTSFTVGGIMMEELITLEHVIASTAQVHHPTHAASLFVKHNYRNCLR